MLKRAMTSKVGGDVIVTHTHRATVGVNRVVETTKCKVELQNSRGGRKADRIATRRPGGASQPTQSKKWRL